MSKEEKNIDSLFRKQLDDFECSPTDASWKFLKMKMSHTALKRRLIIIFSSVFSAGVIILGFFLLNSKNEVSEKYLLDEKSTSLSVNKVENINQEGFKYEKREKKLSSSRTSQNIEVDEKGEADKLTEVKNFTSIKLTKSDVKSSLVKLKTTKATAINKEKLGYLNSDFDDYAPVIKPNANFIYFTSRRPVTKKEIRKGKGRERIYYAERTQQGWTKPKLAKDPINSSDNFSSAVSLSQNGKTLFIYRDDYHGNGDIFAATLTNGKWSEPEALPEPINSEYHESTVTMTSDGNTMFFTSNRPGGKGGLDIWYTKKNNSGLWGEAKNLGSKINSEQHEEGVFLHPNDKTLFFSSKRKGGFGGYDIYYTTLENGEWSEPKNLGEKINTKNDDVYFMIDAKNNQAFVTSSKIGTDAKDLFTLNWSDSFINRTKKQQEKSKVEIELEVNNAVKKGRNLVAVFLVKDGKVLQHFENKNQSSFEFKTKPNENYEIVLLCDNYVPIFDEIHREDLQEGFILKKKYELKPIQEEVLFSFKVYGDKNKKARQIDKTLFQQVYQYLGEQEGYAFVNTPQNIDYLKSLNQFNNGRFKSSIPEQPNFSKEILDDNFIYIHKLNR